MILQLTKGARALTADGVFRTTQYASRPYTWYLSRRIGLKTYLPHGFVMEPGTLVLANHRSVFDPFLVTFHLVRASWLPAAPTRFPTKSEYARHLILGPVIKMLGAYDIGDTPMEKAKKLLYTRDLLTRGRSVLLFPEGKIVSEGHVVEEFQRGAHMLFANDHPTIFVHMLGFNSQSFITPSQVENPRMYFSPVIRGSAHEKVTYMEEFFSAHI